MSLRIFVSQTAIDTWVSNDQVDLLGEIIVIKPSGLALRLAPASFFKSVAGGAEDRHALIGKVKDQLAIGALGGEAYMSSVVLGEDAYDVEPGFVAVEPESHDGGAALLAALRAM